MKALSRMFILWVLGVGLIASGVVLRGAEGPALSISPEGVLTGKTLTAGETFEMTLHVQGDADTEYGLAVEYAGDIGTCASEPVPLTTNPQGKAVWTCELATSDTPGEGSVTFILSKDDAEAGRLVALLTVKAAEVEEEPELEEPPAEEDPAAERADNHGGCVSYWAHRAKADGLEGSFKGQFVSSIAQTDCTTSTREDAEFVAMFDEALAEQTAALESGDARPHGKPENAGSQGKSKQTDE